MIYGFLIGIIIAGIVSVVANPDDYSLHPSIRFSRSYVRLIGNSAALIAVCTLVGLLIRGA